MKVKLGNHSSINIMKRNSKLEANTLYLLSSESTANSLYFETKRDIKRAHKLMNKHLLGTMDILDYLFTPDGWVLIVKVKSKEAIIQNVKNRLYKSKKMKSALRRKEISIIVSELIRYVISGIARIINSRNRRLGAVVRRNFSRYIFDSVESIEKIMRQMKKEQLVLCHQKKRYRPSRKWYDLVGGFVGKGDVFLCSENRVGVNDMGGVEVGLMEVSQVSKYVLQEIIERTKTTHHPQISRSKPLF